MSENANNVNNMQNVEIDLLRKLGEAIQNNSKLVAETNALLKKQNELLEYFIKDSHIDNADQLRVLCDISDHNTIHHSKRAFMTRAELESKIAWYDYHARNKSGALWTSYPPEPEIYKPGTKQKI